MLLLCYNIVSCDNAPVAELADAPDLGSGVPDVKVQVLSPAPLNERAPSNGSFFVMGPSQGLEPAKERA